MKIAIGILCGLVIVVAGCVRESLELERPAALSELKVVGVRPDEPAPGTAAANTASTRATITNGLFTFADGDAMSLFMRGETGTSYTDVDNRKVTYASTTSTEAGTTTPATWGIEGDRILLNDQRATVSMVYPYAPENTYNNIPFTTGVYATGIDLLWKQQTVFSGQHEAKVETMHHALTRVKILLKRDAATETAASGTVVPADRYTGAGAVTSVSIANAAGAGAAVYTDGVLDLSSVTTDGVGNPNSSLVKGKTAGTLTDNTAFNLPEVVAAGSTTAESNTEAHLTDMLTLPVASLTDTPVTLVIDIDGKKMVKTLPATTVGQWETGKCYTYTVTVKNTEIMFDKVTVTDWITGTPIDGELDPKITIGAYKDGGIVFWIDPANVNHYKVVSLDERTMAWGEVTAWAANYGAGWGLPTTEIWRLPTTEELIEIYNARTASLPQGSTPPDDSPADLTQSYLDRGISGNGGVAIGTGAYWSSEETTDITSSMQTVNLNNSTIGSSAKTERLAARAVKELPVTVNLSKSGMANCYIASWANTRYMFDATVRGNGVDTDGSTLAKITGAASAKVIWQTDKLIEPGTVKFENGKIYFTLAEGFNPSDGGSALIALYSDADAAGSILWSWHIWVTDYRPDVIVKTNEISQRDEVYTTRGVSGQVHTYGRNYWTTCPNRAIMDRNLGAEKALYDFAASAGENWPTFGLFYEWGRKDPFPGAALNTTGTIRPLYQADGTSRYSMPSRLTSRVAVDVAVTLPTTYIGVSNDWTSPSNDHLWNSSNGGKTAYDPCPPGWRSAPLGIWNDFTLDGTCTKSSTWTAATDLKGGRLYSAGNVRAWYPASGSRGSSDGGLFEVAIGGSSWAATIASGSLYHDAPRMRVTYNSVEFSRSTLRAAGCPVRCVQE